MRLPAYLGHLVFGILLPALVLSGCGGSPRPSIGIEPPYGGGSGGSGGIGIGSAGPITSGPIMSGGTSGGPVMSGGSAGSGGPAGSSGSPDAIAFERLGTAVFSRSDIVDSAMVARSASEASGPTTLHGLVNGGHQAVAGARVYLLEASDSGPGSASISLLAPHGGGAPDSIGYSVNTASDGSFSIPDDSYVCTPGHSAYLYVHGGRSGESNATNPAIGLMAALGPCPSTGAGYAATIPFVTINEISTIAAAYALANFAADSTHVSGTPLAQTALADAFTNAANLANLATGTAYTAMPSNPSATVPQSRINTLANILSTCIDSNGSLTAAPIPTPCYALFSKSRSSVDTMPGAGGSMPSDTATAALNIARSPTVNTATLFTLQLHFSTDFQPELTTAPADFILPVTFTVAP